MRNPLQYLESSAAKPSSFGDFGQFLDDFEIKKLNFFNPHLSHPHAIFDGEWFVRMIREQHYNFLVVVTVDGPNAICERDSIQ